MKMVKPFRCESGAAAAEMALVLPILIVLMFGSFELGNYFLNEHVVVKAVRDGARFASRQSFTYFPCTTQGTGLSISDTTIRDRIKEVTRTGQIISGVPRLNSWQDNSDIAVNYDCVPTNSNAKYSGIYANKSYAPRVKVSVQNLGYQSLFTNMGFFSNSLTLNAESQAAVAGI